MKEDLYRILGIPRDADESEIRSAHRALAKRYHPDAGIGSSSERFRSIQDAYDILGDPGRRAEYDSSLRRQEQRPVRTMPSVRFYPERSAPFSAHVDLRQFSRGGRAECIGPGPRARFAR